MLAPPTAPDPTTSSGESAMRREIGVVLGALLVVNATIGTGIFKTPANVARLSGSLSAALLAWVAGGAIALCGALTLAELAAALPRTGGLYEYLRRAYGPAPAFLFGWTKLTLLMPSAVGSFAKLAAEATAALLGLAPDTTRDAWMAVAFLGACAAANVMGIRATALQQGAITLAKYAGVLLLAVAGLFAALPIGDAVAVPLDAPPFASTVTVTGCFTALVSVMWAYDGWADLASLSGEVRDPGRSLPRALIAGTLAVVLVYLAANAGYARVLGLDGLRRSTTGSNMAAANLAVLTLGEVGRTLLAALVLVSCFGGCLSSLLTGSRVLVPMATDGLFVRALGTVSPRTGVPARAVVVSALLGMIFVSVRSFEQLTEAFVVGYFPFYILAVVAVGVLRRREPALLRPFRVPGYPFVPLVFLAGSAALLAGAAAGIDRTGAFALGVMLLGLPVGWGWRRFGATARAPSGTRVARR